MKIQVAMTMGGPRWEVEHRGQTCWLSKFVFHPIVWTRLMNKWADEVAK